MILPPNRKLRLPAASRRVTAGTSVFTSSTVIPDGAIRVAVDEHGADGSTRPQLHDGALHAVGTIRADGGGTVPCAGKDHAVEIEIRFDLQLDVTVRFVDQRRIR